MTLKHTLTAYLVLLLGLAVALLSFAAGRLFRHGMVMQSAHAARCLLAETAGGLESLCPGVFETHACPELAGWVQKKRAAFTDLLSVTLLDPDGRAVACSDPDRVPRAMWGALGSTPIAARGEDWSVVEEPVGRELEVVRKLGREGWRLRASLSLVRVDADASRATVHVWIYAGLVAAVMALIGWLLLFRLLLRPIDRLLEVSSRISEQGDWTLLLQAERGSELGRLGASLSRMGRRIEADQARMQAQIAELEKLNRELGQAQQSLIRSEKLASVGRLAAGLAHELGNPIAAVLGYAGMLRTEQLPESERDEILARVEREVERVDRIIKDLLAYSRPGRGERVALDPAALVEDATGLLVPQARSKDVRVERCVPEGLPALASDPERIRQVLVNLLFNALDAVERGGRIWIRVLGLQREGERLCWLPPGEGEEPEFFESGPLHRVRPPREGRAVGDCALVFAVVDDGQGIDPADLPNVFDPFFTTKEPGRGTGLGLAICHAAVGSLGGEIWAYSLPGQGTQIAFWLPAASSSHSC